MSRCRVVQSEIVRLPLSDGDYLDVNKELNAGEYVGLLTALAERKPFAKILAYVVGWSLIGLNSEPLPYSVDLPEEMRRATIAALDKGTLREMIAALDRHETIEDAAREAKKKTPPTAPISAPSLASVGS